MRLHRELVVLVIVVVLFALHAALPAREPNGAALPRVLWASRNLSPAAPSGTIRVYGTFSDGDEITADGAALSTTYIDQSTLEATFTSDQLAIPSSFEVRVRDNNGQSMPLQVLVASPRYGVLLGSDDVAVPAAPTAIDTALLDGDQRRDLIYITGGATPQLWTSINNGAGFDPAVALPLTNPPTSFAVGDVNNDQHDDLLVNQGGAGIVSVFRNDGDGVFTLLDEVAAGHSAAQTIATGDFNGDGRLDFVVANTSEASVGVHLANGDDTWTSEPPVATVSNPAYPAVADLNQDGFLDVLVISTTTGALTRHMGSSTGTLAAGVTIPVTAGTNAMMIVDDVNGDGLADIITSRLNAFFSPQMLRLEGNGDGTFDAAAAITMPIAPLPTAVSIVDVNNDNQADLVETDGLSSLHILRGDGAGGFSFWTTLTTAFYASPLAAADLDDDGEVDFVIGGQDTSVFPAQPHLSVLRQEDPGPRPRLVFPDKTFAEPPGNSQLVSMPVLLRDDNDQPVASTVPITITLEFVDGTAKLGTDYSLSPATSFPIEAGVTEGEIQFRLRGDNQFEATETFSIRIKTTTDGAVLGDDTAIVTVTDDDPPPPAADLAALFVMDDTFAPGVSITGTVTLRNNGPANAAQAGIDLPLDVENPGKLTNLHITNSTFGISVVDQGRIKGGSLVLPAGTEASLSFSATPTAAARAFSDHVAIAGNLSNPVEFVQPGSLRNLGSVAGRTGVGFDQDGDGKVNDVLFYDPGPNALRLVHNVDGGAASQTHTIDLAAFAGYTVSDMDVCRRGGSAVQSVVMSLVQNPGGSGDRSIVVAHEMPVADPIGAPFVSVFPNLSDKTVTRLHCVDLDGDTTNDVAALYSGSGGVLLSLDPSGTVVDLKLFTATSLAADFATGDVDQNGVNDIVVIEQSEGQVLVLLDVANGAGTSQVSAINLQDLFDSHLIGGSVADPVTQVRRIVDFNSDGFPDFAVFCSRCGSGDAPAIVPLLNAGVAAPGTLRLQAPITLQNVTALHRITDVAVVNNKIIATESGGHVIELTNTTPSSATVASFDVNITRQCGSGLSGIVPVNLFNDATPDHLYTGCFGRILATLGAGSATDDPNPANDGEETRVVGLTIGPPDLFTIDANGLLVERGTVSVLHNTADDPSIHSLNGAMVSILNAVGDRIVARVLRTTDDTATFQWPFLADNFTSATPLTLVATTPGGSGVSSTALILPENGLPTVSISDGVSDFATEGTATAAGAHFHFTISLSAPSSDPVTVTYTTADGTAFGGLDYYEVTGSVTFAPGETSKEVLISTRGDQLDESDETFFVNLSNAVAANIGDGQGVGTIVDDDDPPQLKLQNLSATEGDNGAKNVAVTVSLVGPAGAPDEGQPTTSGKTITAQVTTTNQSAIAGADFNLLDDTVSFTPGTATATIGLDVIGDTVFSLDKTLLINLVATNATAPAASIFTILNDDPMPTLSIVPSLSGSEGSGRLSFTVTLSAPSEDPVTVDYDTRALTAEEADDSVRFPSGDYLRTHGTLTFAPGETAKTLDVLVMQDPLTEDDETFELGLFNATGAAIANATSLGTIVDDDNLFEDLVPPVIDPVDDVTAFAQSGAGARIVYIVPKSSDNVGVVSISCAPASGEQFPIGVTAVTCTAEDAAGNTAQSTFSVIVNVGTPSIAGRIAGQGVASPGVQFFDVELQNNGTGTALAVQASAFQFRLPTGRILPLNGLTGALPIAVGDLQVGEKRTVRVYLDLPAAVNRLQLIVNGAFTDVLAAPRRFTFSGVFNVIR